MNHCCAKLWYKAWKKAIQKTYQSKLYKHSEEEWLKYKPPASTSPHAGPYKRGLVDESANFLLEVSRAQVSEISARNSASCSLGIFQTERKFRNLHRALPKFEFSLPKLWSLSLTAMSVHHGHVSAPVFAANKAAVTRDYIINPRLGMKI